MQVGPTLHDWHHNNGFGQINARFANAGLVGLRELSRMSREPLEQHERRAGRAKSLRLP